MSLRIHYIQHVRFEGLGNIEPWAVARGHRLSATRTFARDPFPTPDQYDWLIIMGGPMGANDDDRHVWMAGEKETIRAAIDAGKGVLGICLGAQLIAHVLGARVYPGPEKEIGWLPIGKSEAGRAHPLLTGMPDPFTVFHWHGDTFDLPAGATLLASSVATRHQAFIYGDRVVGLQFHLENSPETIAGMVEQCADELDTTNRYVQSADTIRAGLSHCETNTRALEALLLHMESLLNMEQRGSQ
jgi:GMP synthase-like glutamine amidotransferase